ncbi:response regulator transcription factor [Sinorhizobium terangae]|uniref:response regulator transcription factor n=1 Tax=Sinorhizobium terangae TaxID=110322 RepID=UPI0024B151B2|nr:response regulator [Sinorhizobium terangae]WFU49845.1 response regulator [Sinorhizobium terangae]
MSNSKGVVAVVDDDRRVLDSLADLLESAGHAVRAFSSAHTLLNSDAVPEIDCLITDLGMPGMDGFELKRVMSEMRPGLPVILITGRHEIPEPQEAKHNRFFRKPFDGQALLAAIGEALAGQENLP